MNDTMQESRRSAGWAPLMLVMLCGWSATAVSGTEPAEAAAVAASAVAVPAAAAAAPAAPSPEFLALQQRAEKGERAARFELARAIELGEGSGKPRNLLEAIPWFEKAAAQGHAEAQSRLGAYYRVANKHEQALQWLRKAAAQDHARATHALASMYDMGQGVTQDGPQAVQWYTRAAELGWPESMWNLANIYGSGRYGAADMTQACVWALRAHLYAGTRFRVVQKEYDKRLPLIESKLGDAGMTTCRQQAAAWKPRSLPPEVEPLASTAP